MVEPIAKPTPAKPAQRQPSQSTKVAPPSTGETVRPGQSRVETGSTSNEGGLSTGGTGGASNQGNVNFCDPQYLGQMVSLIYANWRRETAVAAKPDHPLRDPAQRDPHRHHRAPVERLLRCSTTPRSAPSILTRAIPPLPACYPHSDYAMNLTFEYIR